MFLANNLYIGTSTIRDMRLESRFSVCCVPGHPEARFYVDARCMHALNEKQGGCDCNATSFFFYSGLERKNHLDSSGPAGLVVALTNW